jgi:hypothetical protein
MAGLPVPEPIWVQNLTCIKYRKQKRGELACFGKVGCKKNDVIGDDSYSHGSVHCTDFVFALDVLSQSCEL